MSKLVNFDIDSLTLKLNDELNVIVSEINSSNISSGMIVDGVKVRMGQKPTDSAPFVNNLNSARYPDEEPWEIEVNYRIGSRTQTEQFLGSQIVLAKNVADKPVKYVKGINSFWERRWNEVGVATIGELMLCDEEKVLELCKKAKSIVPLDHHSRVLLLNQKVNTLAIDSLLSLKLTEVLFNKTDDLQQLFGFHLSGQQIAEIQHCAQILLIVFDASFFQSLTMAVFQ